MEHVSIFYPVPVAVQSNGNESFSLTPLRRAETATKTNEKEITMQQTHLLSAPVFRPGQPSSRGLYGSFAKPLVWSAFLITANLNEDNSRDLENPIPGIPGALLDLGIEGKGTTYWKNQSEGQFLMEEGTNTGRCRHVTVVTTRRSNGPSGILINGAGTSAVPDTATTTACAIAIHRAGANGGYT